DLETLLPCDSSETCVPYVLRNELDTIQNLRREYQRDRAYAGGALVLVVGTTCSVDQLAPWLLAPHRFSLHLELEPCLEPEELQELLRRQCRQLAESGAAEEAAKALCKLGGRAADAAAAARLAGVAAVRRMVQLSEAAPQITAEDLSSAVASLSRVQLTAQWRAKVLCAAYEVPMADNSPSASAVDNALYTGIGFADGSNGTCDVEGILVSRFAGEEFEVRCKVVGGDQVFGQGRRAVLRPVPLLMGCYADFDNDRDLPEDRGVQTQVSCADSCFGSEYFGLQ
ncbi:unnamed protein product, partial [Effrenium voratum]